MNAVYVSGAFKAEFMRYIQYHCAGHEKKESYTRVERLGYVQTRVTTRHLSYLPQPAELGAAIVKTRTRSPSQLREKRILRTTNEIAK